MKAKMVSLLCILVLLGSLLPGQILPVTARNRTIKPSSTETYSALIQRHPPFTLQPSQSPFITSTLILALDLADHPSSSPVDPSREIFESSNVGYLSQIGGANKAVAIQGNYAYVGAGLRMVILDISDPTAPVEVGRTAPMPDVVMDIAVSGSYAYIADDSGGLRIFNVANHADPFLVSSYIPSPEGVGSVAVAGDYAYLGGGTRLQVVNIAHPDALYAEGFLDIPWVFNHITKITAAGHYVYAAIDYGGPMAIVNAADPTAPFIAGTFAPDTWQFALVNDVAVVGDYAYVVLGIHGYSSDEGLYIVDIRNPASPYQVGHYDPGADFTNVAVSGNYAYLLSSFLGSLRIVNITHPDGPYEVGNFDIANSNGITVADGLAYVASRSGLQIVDVAKPSAPFAAGHYDIVTPLSIAVAGGYAYIANGYGLRIFDIADPNSLSEVGYIDTPGDAQNVTLNGNYAYIADGYFGVRIVDISDPTAPSEVGFYDMPSNAIDVAVANGFAYVADARWGMHIVDVSDPSAPFVVGYYRLHSISDVVVTGDYAYVINQPTMRILNITNPAAPFEVGNFYIGYTGREVAVDGDYAYLGGDSLYILDVSDPATPIEVGYYDTDPQLYGDIYAVAVAGAYAYVTTNSLYNRGLQVVNVVDPSSPFEVGYYYDDGYFPYFETDHSGFNDVAVAGNNAYLAAGEMGLYILRYTGDMDFESKIALPLSMK